MGSLNIFPSYRILWIDKNINRQKVQALSCETPDLTVLLDDDDVAQVLFTNAWHVPAMSYNLLSTACVIDNGCRCMVNGENFDFISQFSWELVIRGFVMEEPGCQALIIDDH